MEISDDTLYELLAQLRENAIIPYELRVLPNYPELRDGRARQKVLLNPKQRAALALAVVDERIPARETEVGTCKHEADVVRACLNFNQQK